MPHAPPTVRRVALVGGRESGKTSAMMALVATLTDQGFRVGGVLQPARHEGGERIGYDLFDPFDGARFPFARRRAVVRPDELSFTFDDEGWAWAAGRIRRARGAADLLVVDEIGKLEARGRGHLPALQTPLDDERCGVWVLSVRDLALRPLSDALGRPDDELRLTGDPVDGEALRRTIFRWLRPNTPP